MRLITLAIHTYDRAVAVKNLLEAEGIEVTLQNVNLEQPEISSGVRVRIDITDLPLALRIVENPHIFSGYAFPQSARSCKHAILVPTDFSDLSINAARVALRLAATRKTEVVFLHAYIDPGLSGSVQLSDNLTYDITDTEMTEHLVAAANGSMAKFAAKIRQMMKCNELPMVPFSTAVVEGVPEEAIVAFTKQNTPYLVVMGTRSKSRKEREFIGSVTAEVLDAGRFSVLTVPEPAAPQTIDTPHNILFFGNIDQEDIIAMDTLYRYFSNSNAEVTIIHIPQRHRLTERFYSKSADALSEYCTKTFEHFNFKTVTVSPDKAIDELEALQNEHNFDLLVLPNKRKNALARMLNPGLAHKILFQADIPMLVIPI